MGICWSQQLLMWCKTAEPCLPAVVEVGVHCTTQSFDVIFVSESVKDELGTAGALRID